MSARNPPRPRSGWLYMLDPDRVSALCSAGHTYLYQNPPEAMACQHPGCSQKINPSHIYRGEHPYLVWFADGREYTSKLTVLPALPLTSKETFATLPTTCVIQPSSENGLQHKSYAVVHQLTAVDTRCFQHVVDGKSRWRPRMGQLQRLDRDAIAQRLRFHLGLDDAPPSEDWLQRNVSPEFVRRIFRYLPPEERVELVEDLMNALDE